MFFKTFAEKQREQKGARYDADMRRAKASARTVSVSVLPNVVLRGGNHLSSVLIRRVGADFAERFPPDTDPESVLRLLGATDEFDIWCAWSAIMLHRGNA